MENEYKIFVSTNECILNWLFKNLKIFIKINLYKGNIKDIEKAIHFFANTVADLASRPILAQPFFGEENRQGRMEDKDFMLNIVDIYGKLLNLDTHREYFIHDDNDDNDGNDPEFFNDMNNMAYLPSAIIFALCATRGHTRGPFDIPLQWIASIIRALLYACAERGNIVFIQQMRELIHSQRGLRTCFEPHGDIRRGEIGGQIESIHADLTHDIDMLIPLANERFDQLERKYKQQYQTAIQEIKALPPRPRHITSFPGGED